MNVDSGTFARNTTGNATYIMNLAFAPDLILFFVSGKNSGDTEPHMAVGYWHDGGVDGTLQESNGKASQTRNKTLSHYEGSTEKIAFTCTGVDPAGEFDLNWTAADSNYTIHWIALAT